MSGVLAGFWAKVLGRVLGESFERVFLFAFGVAGGLEGLESWRGWRAGGAGGVGGAGGLEGMRLGLEAGWRAGGAGAGGAGLLYELL